MWCAGQRTELYGTWRTTHTQQQHNKQPLMSMKKKSASQRDTALFFPHMHMEYFNDTSEDTMNAETDTMNTDCEADSSAAFYGYDEDRAIYGYEDRVSSEIMDSFPEGPGSPLPADRLARKQRLFLRRGGACHSTLLQSAVMACMSSPKDDEGKPGFSSLESSASLLTSSSGEASTSPRKRLRRTDRPKATVDDKVVAGASVLLASLSMSPLDGGGTSDHHRRSGPDFKRAPPIRRVSRRKSYNSVASGASDYDDEEFAELLDRDD